MLHPQQTFLVSYLCLDLKERETNLKCLLCGKSTVLIQMHLLIEFLSFHLPCEIGEFLVPFHRQGIQRSKMFSKVFYVTNIVSARTRL